MNKVLLLLGVMIVLVSCSPAPITEAPTAVATEPQPTKVGPTQAQIAQGPWKMVAASTYTHAVDYVGFRDESFGITVGYAGEIHYTIDGGATWPQASNSSMCRFGLEVVDDQVAWHCGNGGDVRKSTDGGHSWMAVTDFGPNEPDQCRFLSFLDGTTGWAANRTLLGATSDGGETWQEIAFPEDAEQIIAMELRTPQDGYLLGSNGKLYVTADGGKSWTAQVLDFMKDAFTVEAVSPVAAMRFMDEKHGIVVVPRGSAKDGFYIWSAYTEDGGATWREDQVSDKKGVPTLYLSRDGLTLTIFKESSKEITVWQFQP